MKSLIIYHSISSNTEKLARVLADKINADLVSIKDSEKVRIDNYDFIGFGSGIYKESMPPQLFHYVEGLNLKGKNVFVFSTSGIGMGFYNKKLVNLLKSKDARCKGSYACKGSFTSRNFSNNKIFEFMSKFAIGHPNDKDLGKAVKFIEKIVNQSNV